MTEAIILAGGFGTRLREVVADVPKPMALLRDRPFLAHLLDYLERQNITRVILATGYKHQVIAAYFGNRFHGLVIDYSVEETPLGTGGAIRKALALTSGPAVYILNGDTFFEVDFPALRQAHLAAGADLTLALKWEAKTERYGQVLVRDQLVAGFQEKGAGGPGYINGGVYLANCDLFTGLALPERFSFEDAFLTRYYRKLRFGVCCAAGYFVDIGIPDDYHRAQREMSAAHE